MLQRFVRRLLLLKAHQSLLLLRNCGAIPKLQYVLRASRVCKNPAVLPVFDEVLKDAISNLTNIKMSNVVWLQASLPVRRGGLGVRRAETLAFLAFLASAFSGRSIFELLSLSDVNTIFPKLG